MEQNTMQDKIVIDLGELFAVIKRRIWIILLSLIVLGTAAYLISKFVLVPKYQSSTQIYVMNKQNENVLTYSDIQSGTQLTKDFMTLVTSRPVIEMINTELNLGMSYSEIVKLISVSNPDNTRILKITVEYTDPYMAKAIADAIREASASHIKTVMDIDQVNVIEVANIPEGKSSPDIIKNTIIGASAGAFIAGLIIFLIYISDDTIKTPDDVENHLRLSVLSSIPLQAGLSSNKRMRKKEKKREKKLRKKTRREKVRYVIEGEINR